jgi:hypothetical protein
MATSLVERQPQRQEDVEYVTLSSESASSSETRFSLVNPQPLSTAPTSAEVEGKPAHLKLQSTSSDNVDLEQITASGALETAVQAEPRPIQTPTPDVTASLPVFTVTATPIPSIPIPTSQPFVNAPAVSLAVVKMWQPLINTLRQNGGTLPYTALPPKLLKSYPGAYGLAGRSKYKQYIQLAVESGIVVEQKAGENCPAPANTSGYAIANSISALARSFGSVKVFKAYLEISDQSRSSLRSELQSSGVSLVDCPHNGRKDVADKMILGQKYTSSSSSQNIAESIFLAQLTCYPMPSITLHHLPFFLSLATATSPMHCQSSRIATIELYWSNGLIHMSA